VLQPAAHNLSDAEGAGKVRRSHNFVAEMINETCVLRMEPFVRYKVQLEAESIPMLPPPTPSGSPLETAEVEELLALLAKRTETQAQARRPAPGQEARLAGGSP
jgi:hypothetical protein